MSIVFKETNIDCPNCKNGKLNKLVDPDQQIVANYKICKKCGRGYTIKYGYRIQDLEVDEIAIDESTGEKYCIAVYKEN